MRNLKKFVKPMEVKLRSKMSHWPKIPHRYAGHPYVCNDFVCNSLTNLEYEVHAMTGNGNYVNLRKNFLKKPQEITSNVQKTDC